MREAVGLVLLFGLDDFPDFPPLEVDFPPLEEDFFGALEEGFLVPDCLTGRVADFLLTLEELLRDLQ